jgi:hypothetical protein
MALPTRTSSDPNAAADINSLQTQISALGASINFTLNGNAVTGDKQISARVPSDKTYSTVKAKVDTAPAGSNLKYDVTLDGATVLPSVLVIATGATTGTASITSTAADFTEGQIVSINVDAVGSATAGGNNSYIEVE